MEKRKYQGDELIAFIHGYTYAKAEYLKENTDYYKDWELNSIIGVLINHVLKEKEVKGTFTERSVMLSLQNVPFYCSCGGNVLTEFQKAYYRCNSCKLEYYGI